MFQIVSWTRLTMFVVIAELAGVLGSLFTFKSIPAWYAKLNKPTFGPPNWLFGPVWTALYALQGLAAYLVYEQRNANPSSNAALWLFWIQLALNALWTPLFFGLKNPQLAFYEIIILWIFIVLTTVWFFRVNLIAGTLFLPYLAWVTFASALNFYIWRLNP